jgi:peptidoglycan hydrolase-like protein with peptidoglycan-binding domain
MTRTLALAAGLLFAAVSAGSLSAQSTAPAKPSPTTSTMQHSQRDSSAASPSSSTTVHHAAWTKAQVTEAQQGLAKTGFYKGKINGKYNKSTKRAISAYQKANKLPVTGRLDNDLLTRLHSS